MSRPSGHITASLRRLRRLRRRYKSETKGATAIEFAMVALPFLGLIFGILELALVFFTGAVLTQAMSDTGRYVRVGAFQGCGGAAEFKGLICNRMSNLMNCNENLRVDLTSANEFQSITLPDPGMSGLDPDDEDSEIEVGTYVDTTATVPVVLRATFYYPLILPNFMTRLETVSGSGRHIISAATAFRNEPFPDGGSCNSSLADELAPDDGG